MVYLACLINRRSGVRIPPSLLILNTIDMETLKEVGRLARMVAKISEHANQLEEDNERLLRNNRAKQVEIEQYEKYYADVKAEVDQLRANQAELVQKVDPAGNGWLEPMHELLAELKGIAEFYAEENKYAESKNDINPHADPAYLAREQRLHELNNVIGLIEGKYLTLQ